VLDSVWISGDHRRRDQFCCTPVRRSRHGRLLHLNDEQLVAAQSDIQAWLPLKCQGYEQGGNALGNPAACRVFHAWILPFFRS
jgi:hypothetical protein